MNQLLHSQESLRVLQLTIAHKADDARIYHRIARTLASAGYEVSVAYPSHRARHLEEGVRAVGVDIGQSRLGRVFGTRAFVADAIHRTQPAVVHFHDPELLVAVDVMRRAGATVIYDAHEDFPADILTKQWIPSVLRSLVASCAGNVERWSAARVDAVICATESIARRFERATVVRNMPRLASIPLTGKVRGQVCYPGTISRARRPDVMVRAMELVKSDCRLVLAGPVTDPGLLEELSRLPGWERCDYRGEVSTADALRILAESEVGLHVVPGLAHFAESLPVKVFEYMGAGTAVVASDFPLWRHLVGDRGAGVLVTPDSVEEVAQAIDQLLGDRRRLAAASRAGVSAAREHFSWEAEARKLLGLYESLLSGRHRRAQ